MTMILDIKQTMAIDRENIVFITVFDSSIHETSLQIISDELKKLYTHEIIKIMDKIISTPL